MNKELDAILCKRYPLIFADRNGDITTSCMPFGFECGDGWFTLIDTLCGRLQSWTDNNGVPQVVAIQVKEKYGKLSFTATCASEMQWGMITMTEALSMHICDECGDHGQLLVAGGWLMTRCQAHAPDNAITYDEYQRSAP